MSAMSLGVLRESIAFMSNAFCQRRYRLHCLRHGVNDQLLHMKLGLGSVKGDHLYIKKGPGLSDREGISTAHLLGLFISLPKSCHSNRISFLCLSSSGLSSDSMIVLSRCFSTQIIPNVAEFDISDNDIGDHGFSVLCNSLQNCRSFKKLFAADIHLTTRFNSASLGALMTNSLSLRTLQVASTAMNTYDVNGDPLYMEMIMNIANLVDQTSHKVALRRHPEELPFFRRKTRFPNIIGVNLLKTIQTSLSPTLDILDIAGNVSEDVSEHIVALIRAIRSPLRSVRLRLPIHSYNHDLLTETVVVCLRDNPNLSLDFLSLAITSSKTNANELSKQFLSTS